MPRLTLPILLATSLLGAACTSPPPRLDAAAVEAALSAAVDSTVLYRHMAVLAADSMEGRGTGTRGEERAIRYIRQQMEAIGLEGGAPGGGFFQEVPLRGSTPVAVSNLVLTTTDGRTERFAFFDDFTVATDTDAEEAAVEGRLLFVGYGITNPAYDWDDYKDVDVTGRLLVILVNDPPATPEEPNLFQGDTLTYNGRWTYKYEEARRRGARGVLLVHTDELAGYPFGVLQATARSEQLQLDTPPENPLVLRGWIRRGVAERLAELSGTTLEAWIAAAGRRDFRPQELPVSVSLSARFTVRRLTGTNVIGRLRGREAPDEAVLYTAHHDHLGMDEARIAAGEDGIYNGAVDNASGVAMLLAVADAFARLPERPRRTVLFATVTAEEHGLLGSTFLAEHPPLPLARIVANVNLDAGNLFGATEDIVGIGAERSTLRDVFREAAAEEGLAVSPDPQPGQGFFFRSDQLALARGGVPGVFLNTGRRFVGQPPSYADSVFAAFNRERYHQPSDVMHDGMRFAGLVQQTRVAFRLGLRLADSDLRPTWNPTEPFAEARRASEAALRDG